MVDAINQYGWPGDKVDIICHQEQHSVGNIDGSPKATDRHAGDGFLQHWLGYGAHHIGIGLARRCNPRGRITAFTLLVHPI